MLELQKDRKDSELRLARLRRRRISLAFSVALIGVSSMIISPILDNYYSLLLTITGIACLILSGAVLIMIYLQTGFRKTSLPETSFLHYEHEFSTIKKQINSIPQLIQRLANMEAVTKDLSSRLTHEGDITELNDEQKANIIKIITSKLQNEAAQEVLASIEQTMAERNGFDSRRKEVFSYFDRTLGRLRQEVMDLGRRGNLNLSLGIATTIAGLAILTYYVFSSQPMDGDAFTFTSLFVPRLTLVVFIEVFAYFFLRLYKSSLTEIKYFQNEMTNVELHCVALTIATAAGYDDTCKDVIRGLGETERNHVLQENQTTGLKDKMPLREDIVSEFAQKVLDIIMKKRDF